ncbi:MAG: hypothetical protein HN368_06245 [Spirochaetales bacterium]|nr:hypothetical protein [Spirochaetales bacterium]
MLGRIRNLLSSVIKIQADEIAITLLMFTYMLTTVGAFIIGRITRSVLILEISNFESSLPYMYIGIAITVSAIMFAYSKFERILRRDQTNSLTLAALILITLLCRLMLQIAGPWFYLVFFIWIEVFGTFLVVQFWSLANEIFHSRQAKRLFPIFGSGGLLAGIIAGFGANGAAKAIGTENLLFVIIGLLVIALATLKLIAVNEIVKLESSHRQPAVRYPDKAAPLNKTKKSIFASKHLKIVAVIVVLTYLVSTIVDYQFHVVVHRFIDTKINRGIFFGVFYGVTNILAILLQLFGTGVILEKYGVLIALLLLPLTMLFGSTLMMFIPVLWIGTLTKGSEQVMRYTVNDATMQMLYLPVPAGDRGRAKAFIDGVLKPLSIGIGGLILALLTGIVGGNGGADVNIRLFSIIAFVLLLVWLLLLFRLKKEYVLSLITNLKKRRLDFSDTSLSFSDSAASNVLKETLLSKNRSHVLHAIELLKFLDKIDPDLHQPLLSLLNHTDPAVRAAALQFISSEKVHFPNQKSFERFLADEDEYVRSLAIRAYCSKGRENSITRIEPFLRDNNPVVKSAAISALIRFGGLDGMLMCAEDLKKMLDSADSVQRERGAWILGNIGVQTFYLPLIPLLADSDEKVKSAALAAAGKLLAPPLVPALVDLLGNLRSAPEATKTLILFGNGIEQILLAAMGDYRLPSKVRSGLPKVLSRIGGKNSIRTLERYIDHPTVSIREQATQALSYMITLQPGIELDKTRILNCIREEADLFRHYAAIESEIFGNYDKRLLLVEAVAVRRRRVFQRIFGLLELIYPGGVLDNVLENLESKKPLTRANAAELLDNVLTPEERELVLPLAEYRLPKKPSKSAGISYLSESERVAKLMRNADIWIRICALQFAGAKKVGELLKEIKTCTQDPEGQVRQTALWALRQVGTDEEIASVSAELAGDREEMVAAYARNVLQEAAQ